MQDPCFVDDRAVTADLYCFVCLDRWMRVSSNDFSRAPRFNNVPLSGTSCRCDSTATNRTGASSQVGFAAVLYRCKPWCISRQKHHLALQHRSRCLTL